MRRVVLAGALSMALAGCGHEGAVDRARGEDAPPVEAQARAVSFKAADGVTVFANFRPVPNARALIVLAHQGGANRAEFRTIAPRLVDAGFATLALDQRSGGTMFGAANRTVATLGASTGFDAAQPDLEAAVNWAQARGRPVILLGSSYSAALATRVAANHPELTGVVLFSPGEYLEDEHAVMAAARRLRVPVFATSSRAMGEVADARALVAAAPSALKVLHAPGPSDVHGASVLTAELNPSRAEGAWTALTDFLDRVAPRTAPGTARPLAR